MKLKDKINEIGKGCENEINQYMELSIFGSILNIIEDSVQELNNEKIQDKFYELKEVAEKEWNKSIEKDV